MQHPLARVPAGFARNGSSRRLAELRDGLAQRLVERVQRGGHHERIQRVVDRDLPNAIERVRRAEHDHRNSPHSGAAEYFVFHDRWIGAIDHGDGRSFAFQGRVRLFGRMIESHEVAQGFDECA